MVKLGGQRMEEEAHVTELEDLLNSNLLKRHQERTQRLQQADVEADRFIAYSALLMSPVVLLLEWPCHKACWFCAICLPI